MKANIYPVDFKLEHQGHPIQKLKWLPKSGEYLIAGTNKRLPRETIGEAQDQVSKQGWEIAANANRQYFRGEITAEQWGKIVIHAREGMGFLHDLICNGGLDADRQIEAATVAMGPDFLVKRKMREVADEDYVDYLKREVARGQFEIVGLGGFDCAVQALFLQGIEEYSPLHCQEAQTAGRAAMLNFLELEGLVRRR